MSLHLLARPHHPAAPASGIVWKMLFDRQQALLHRWASPAFGRAVAELGLRRDALPNLSQLSRLVRQRTGWTLLLTGTPMSEATYYAALSRRELPVVSRLRSFSEFDQPPGGSDLFTDLFGRVPLLLEPGYADALHALGCAWELATTPAAVALLRRFMRATFERGLLTADNGGQPHFYGVALLTSARHLHGAAAAEASTHQPLATAVRHLSQPAPTEANLTAVEPETYFVAVDWADVSAAIQQLHIELLKLQRQAIANRPIPFATVPAEYSSRSRAFAARMPGLRQAD
jgi:phenylalanine-4-hydroxylase